MYICKVDIQGYYLAYTEIEVWDEIPEGWWPLDPPEDTSLDNKMIGLEWVVEARPVYVPPYVPVRVTKADFQRLLMPTERYGLNALRKTIAALQPEDYSDPANTLLVAAEDVMFAFEQPAEFIELNHPETYQGLMLLSYLGIITEARVNEIVSSVNVQ